MPRKRVHHLTPDAALHALPLYHCAQLDVFLGPAIYVGSTNVITAKPTPENLLPLIERHRITSFFAPPTIWISLLRSPLFDTTNLSSLQKGYYGASIMPVEVMREMAQRMTLGYVQRVVQNPAGEIEFIVGYCRWWGWFGGRCAAGGDSRRLRKAL